ncbi:MULTISPECIES: hypothetical protein [Flavobacterium]|uniref:hypothetical protein n=1 Tax=Flavobacterium TaxID=237 RepID=UPI001FCA6AD0|nr:MULTISPECIES: hypothetical protein [Flavobacterium]UOK41126.1 hypothetical protein LZF87_07250 [Flavobacterium enshiense]
MKTLFLTPLILLGTLSVFGQRKSIAIQQTDTRFTISAERTGLSSGYESYYFYVQNNTNREYKIVVNVTLDLACEGSKSYVLGNNDILQLKPNERYSSSSRGEVYNNFGNKNCAIAEGQSFTLFRGMRYSIGNVIDVTKENEDAATKKKADEAKKNPVTQEQTHSPARPQAGSTTSSSSYPSRNSDQNTTYTPKVTAVDVWNKQVEQDKQAEKQALDNFGTLLGNLVNPEQPNDDELAAQEEAALIENIQRRQRETAERNQKVANRKNAFAQLDAADIPLASIEKATSIYYFVYAYDNLANDNPTVYVSNVFEIGKYKDGTRAYTATVKNEIANLTGLTEVLHGYYYSQQQAQQVHNNLISELQNNGVAVKNIYYKGKPSASTTGNTSNGSKYGTVIGTAKIDTRPTNGVMPNNKIDEDKPKKDYGKIIK